ncbi:MAG: hypothetical protein JWO19_4244 [Bryobacterales bacterium]|jgi:hypothetical protein|nr:hypothetical protein [Bryobacterales bacterium]
MKRTLITGFVAAALTGTAFGQAGNQGTQTPPASQGKTQGQSTKDDTTFQKGNPDPNDPTKQGKADPTDPTKQSKDDQKKKGKDKSGKDSKDNGTQGKGNPTVPNPDPTPNPNPATPPPTR